VSGSAAEPETIVCDTSFVGVQERAGGARPNWPQTAVDSFVDVYPSVSLAISGMTDPLCGR
jgi:hypothetical protein